MNCNEVTSAIFYDLSSSGWMEMFGLVELHVAETAAELKPVLNKVEEASQLGHFAIGYICYEAASGLDTSLNHRSKHRYPLAIFAEFEETRPIDLPVDLKAVKLRETIDKNCFSQSIGKIREHLKSRGSTCTTIGYIYIYIYIFNVYMYIYIYVCICMHIYIYIYPTR